MCAPTCRGAAYFAASVFVYRSLLLVLSSISCAITGYKMTYLNVPYMEELMLYLIYFIPLFTSSGFAMMGVDECCFNYVFVSTLGITTTLFVRYGAELTYIYAYDWTAFRLKTPSLFLNIFLDFICISILLVYAYQELRDPIRKEKAKLVNNRNYGYDENTHHRGKSGTTISPGSTPGSFISCSETKNYSNIHNEFERKNVKNSNIEAAAATSNKKINSTHSYKPCIKAKGIGHGAHPGEALHYPIEPVDKLSQKKPLPPLPTPTPGTIDESTELDDISLPPPIPLASPEYDYV